MGKRLVSMGVHRKKLKKHSQKKKRLLKKIIDYLWSDTYMYAPLVSSQPSHFPLPNTAYTSPRGFETRKPREEKSKKLLKKVGDFLKSDTYMYAPLIGSQPWQEFDANTVSPHSGKVWHLTKVTTSISTRKISKKTNQPPESTVEVVREDRPCDDSHLKSSTVVHRTLAHWETAKHVVHQNCRTSSVPERMLGRERRKLVVE